MSVPYNGWLETLTHKARLRERAGLRRSAVPRTPAVDLAGNDYLGLSSDPRVLAAAGSALRTHGLGATGSRLVRGTTDLHEELEEALAEWVGTAGALVYSSGYLANLGAVRALAGLSPNTVVLSDAHCHASIVDGCRLARVETVVFEHGSVPALKEALAACGDRPKVVLTESVFSVDGDLAPLASYHRAARAAGALMLVDDAHGLGVIGALPVAGEPDVVSTATLSKALGGAGGFIAGPAELIRHLVDTSRTFIFDTALPPAVAAGVLAALDIARGAEGDALRVELHERAAMLSPGAPGGIVSLMARGPEDAVQWASSCRDKGVAVGCFRPPSTPDKTSRLRLTVNAGVPRDQFEHALEVIEQCRPPAE
ncbi:MAG TPA: 8-amino-7-oxononanoate synthase [Candidatus Limnocylindrales bacterium]